MPARKTSPPAVTQEIVNDLKESILKEVKEQFALHLKTELKTIIGSIVDESVAKAIAPILAKQNLPTAEVVRYGTLITS